MCRNIATRNNAIWVPRHMSWTPRASFRNLLNRAACFVYSLHLSHVLTISQSQVINILRQGKYKYLRDSIDESFTLYTAPTQVQTYSSP